MFRYSQIKAEKDPVAIFLSARDILSRAACSSSTAVFVFVPRGKSSVPSEFEINAPLSVK